MTNRTAILLRLQMKGFFIFVILLLISTIADGWSTAYSVIKDGDWTLTKEFNPLVRGTSLQTMAWQGVVFTILWCVIFGFAWKKRKDLYPPEEGYTISEFNNYLNTKMQSSIFSMIRLGCIILGITVPITFIPAHFRAALTNMLQIMNILRWNQTTIILVHIIEGFVWVVVGWFLIYSNYRCISRKSLPNKSVEPT